VRARILALVLLLGSPAGATAEWHFKPFVAVTFGGNTTYVDLEQTARKRHLIVGGGVALIGEFVGIEGDFGWAPGFFETGDRDVLVQTGSVRTLTGNVIIAVPRRLVEYTLRPYFVGGFGAMHIRKRDIPPPPGSAEDPVFPVMRTLPVLDVGGGAVGFVSDRFGYSWDLRLFRSLGGSDDPGGSTIGGAPERLSFWRANMSLVIRY
jgi:hypothetical protein